MLLGLKVKYMYINKGLSDRKTKIEHEINQVLQYTFYIQEKMLTT